jgi:hypothetical protein
MWNKFLLLLVLIVGVLYGAFPNQHNLRERWDDTTKTAKKAVVDATFQALDIEDFEGGAHNGHTLERHVGKSDAWLKRRLERQGNIPAASTFPDLKTANNAINAALEAHWPTIQEWLEDKKGRETLNVRHRLEKSIGRGLERGEKTVSDYSRVIVRLEKQGKGFVIWTAYPTE